MLRKSHSIIDDAKIQILLERGTDEVIDRVHLEQSLHSGRRLRVKFGIDPTAADLHIGHSVPLRKLRQFQDLGHRVILLIGDFTARIGDPSGRSETRPMLSDREIRANLKTFVKQANLILNMRAVEVRHNSEWYAKRRPDFFLELLSRFTVDRILERDDFQKRLQTDQAISMLEILYPLLQGYDSVALAADVELGGTDQKFNLLMGRKVQRRYGLPEQDVVTVPLLEGLDGKQKMSKSLGNYVGLTDAPTDMFGKIMSIPDALVEKYFQLVTDTPASVYEKLEPRDRKARLGFEIVKLYHRERAARAAQDSFNKQFRDKELPPNITAYRLGSADKTIVDVLVNSHLVSSKSEARRLITQGGVWYVHNNEQNQIKESTAPASHYRGQVIQVGKRRFVRVQ